MQKLSWKITLNSLILLMFLMLLLFKVEARATVDPSVLLIYSVDNGHPTQEVHYLQNWMRHFTQNITVKRDQDVSSQDFLNKTHVMYLGQTKQQLSTELKKLIETFEGQKLVIGDNGDQINGYEFLRLTDNSTKINRITYEQNELFLLLRDPIIVPLILNNQSTDILIEGYKGEELIGPLAFKQNQHYYLGINNFNHEGIQQIVVELLHSFFESNHSNGKELLIVIDQINPTTNAKDLEKLLELLQKKNISYLLAVSPIYYNEDGATVSHLKANKSLISLLQRSVEHGGHVLLDQQNKNLVFEKGIQELAYHKIFPIGIYGNENIDGMLQVDYYVSGVTISQAANHIPLFDKFTSSNFSVIEFQRLQKKLLDLSMFSDRIISISFSAYLNEEDLKLFLKLIESIEVDKVFRVDDLQSTIKVPHVSIEFQNGSLTGEENLPFFKHLFLTLTLTMVEIILWIIALIVAITIGSFMIYIVWLRFQLRKRLFNERKISHG